MTVYVALHDGQLVAFRASCRVKKSRADITFIVLCGNLGDLTR